MTNAAITSLSALDARYSSKYCLPVVSPDQDIAIEGYGLEVVKAGKLTLLYVYADGADHPTRKVLVRR